MQNNIIDENTLYVLNKNEGILAVFSKDDEDTVIDPEIEETQNSESILTFRVPALSEKWTNTYNPENLYLLKGKMFSAIFADCINTVLDEDGSEIITVKAYEYQKTLERKYVRAWNSTTGFENIDEFMVVILSGGNEPLKNNGFNVPTNFEKGTSGYVLDALLYGTGWRTGICDVEGIFDLETDQINIYENIKKVQELWGGILIFDSLNKIVHHRDETQFLPYSGYEVKEEKNLQTYEYIGDNKIITKLCPLGEGSLNIKSVNEDSIWLTNFSYTNVVYEEVINNPDIFEADKLKRWGERKLQDLCKPRKELSVTTPLLNHVEGYELEEIHLNDIVDVTNYNLEDKTSQLRVIAFRYKVWTDEDAEITLGDITLETTDIFKKNVSATNAINNGTLDTSKIIDYYKNGQSLKETLRQVDQIIKETFSELSKSDDEIKASVTQVTTKVDNLNNDVISQSKTLAQLILSVGSITSKVETLADLTETITGPEGRIVLDKAVEGYLLELSIHGYKDSFQATYLSDNTILDDDLTLLDTSILVNTYTKNKCPTSEEFYEQGYIEKNDLENLASGIQLYKENASLTVTRIGINNNPHYTYSSYGFVATAQTSSNTNNIYYLKINPNTKYLIDLNLETIPNDYFFVVGTYSSNFFSKISEPNFKDFYLNTGGSNYFFDGEWKKNANLTKIELTSNNTDQYLIIYGSWNLIGSRINQIKITNISNEQYLRTKQAFPVEPNKQMYFGIHNSKYRFVNLYLYDKYNNYLRDWNSTNPTDSICGLTDKPLVIPDDVYFMKVVFSKKIDIIILDPKKTDSITDTSGKYSKDSTMYERVPISPTEEEHYEEYYENKYEDVTLELNPDTINDIKPQLEVGSLKTEFIKYNDQSFEFILDDELREITKTIIEDEEEKEIKIYDEFTIIEKNAVLIRRIGVDSQGNLYEKTLPDFIDYGEVTINIVGGQNILEIEYYKPLIIAKYVVQSPYSNLFATQAQVSTIIKQTDDMILLSASKKISKDQLIQEFNSQIMIRPEKILIEGNKIAIKSSYFELTDEGEITATAGHIAGFHMWSDVSSSGLKRSWLTKDFYDSGKTYRSGMIITDDSNTDFIFAGMPIPADGGWSTKNASFRLLNNGRIYAKNLSILHSNGTESIRYEGHGFKQYLSNGNFWSYMGASFVNGIEYGEAIFIHDAQTFSIIDNLHELKLADFKRVGNKAEPSEILFYTDLYINGYRVIPSSSDARLKENIEISTSNALETIEKISHKSFDWKKDKKHINIGYIAQELEKVDKTFVDYNEEFDTYQIDLLNVLATSTKAIQELNEKVEKQEKIIEKQQKIIDMLLNKLGMENAE